MDRYIRQYIARFAETLAGAREITPRAPATELSRQPQSPITLNFFSGIISHRQKQAGSGNAIRKATPAPCCHAIGQAFADGDDTPQPARATGLEPPGNDWRAANLFRGNGVALKIGASGYHQNCARRHGLQAVPGGMAPDLRYLDKAAEEVSAIPPFLGGKMPMDAGFHPSRRVRGSHQLAQGDRSGGRLGQVGMQYRTASR
jgi:hypothetical protein